MYVCVCVCMSVLFIDVYVRTMYVCMYEFRYECTIYMTRMYVCMYVRTYVCMYV